MEPRSTLPPPVEADSTVPVAQAVHHDDLSHSLNALRLDQHNLATSSTASSSTSLSPFDLLHVPRGTQDQSDPSVTSTDATPLAENGPPPPPRVPSPIPIVSPPSSSHARRNSSPVPPTPTSVASFSESKPIVSPAPPTRRTCVVFQDACTHHKYARNQEIGTIVERPERIRAVKTGVAAAWSRLEARSVAHGGAKWDLQQQQSSTNATAATTAAGEEGDELERMMAGMKDLGIKEKGSTTSKDVTGGPFDIIFSSAQCPLDDPALLYTHPLPNLPPDAPSTQLPPPPPVVPAEPPTTPSRHPRTATSTPLRPPPGTFEPSSAPPKLPSSSATSPNPSTLPWPHQLSLLCRSSPTAILTPPTYSEIPSHLPQGDLYLCQESEEAIFGAVGAVCEGVDRIVEGSKIGGVGLYDRAFVAIRPPGHHCCESAPMGFCFINNVAVAAAHAHIKHGIDRVVILDIDLHHGNGTQDIAWRINDEANKAALALASSSPRKGSPKKAAPAPRNLKIMYASLHDIYSYPCEDGDEALVQAASLNLAGGHGQWISNVHIEPFDQEAAFHAKLYPRYRDGLLGAARQFCAETAKGDDDDADRTLVILSAGFDASQHESAGMSRHARAVPTSFFHRFARETVRFATECTSGKVLAVLEGGYSDRALASGSMATLVGLTEAPRLLEKTFLVEDGNEMTWWNETSLGKLERACKPKRGKLVATGTVSEEEAWLARSVEVFSLIEGQPMVESGASKVKKEPVRTMQLRERRPRGGATAATTTEEGKTPLASPTKTRPTKTEPIVAVVTEDPVLNDVEQQEREQEESAHGVEGSDSTVRDGEEGKPRIKFTFKSAGVGV